MNPTDQDFRVPRTIQDAIVQVMTAANFVQKTGKNNHMKYDYASEVDIISVYRPAMVEAGIFIRPFSIEVLSNEQAGKNHRIQATITYRIEGGPGISGHIDVPVMSCGVDTQDKAFAKLYTQALKIALLQTFMIPRGVDPDASYVDPVDPYEEHVRAIQYVASVTKFSEDRELPPPSEWDSSWVTRYRKVQNG